MYCHKLILVTGGYLDVHSLLSQFELSCSIYYCGYVIKTKPWSLSHDNVKHVINNYYDYYTLP